MINRRPLAVLVSGAPGSGKSTLARALGDALRLPVVDKDRVKEGRWRTTGRAAYPDGTSVELFYKTMELWLSLTRRELRSELYDRLDFGCPTIVIDTTDGYDPPLVQVVAEINELYR